MLTRDQVFQAVGNRLQTQKPLVRITYGEAMDLYYEVKIVSYTMDHSYDKAVEMMKAAAAKISGRYLTAEELEAIYQAGIEACQGSLTDTFRYVVEDIYSLLDSTAMYMDLHDLQEMDLPQEEIDQLTDCCKRGFITPTEYQRITGRPAPKAGAAAAPAAAQEETDKAAPILWNVWLQGIYRDSGKPHLAVTRADSDERYMRLLGQVTTDPNDYRDRCKITDPPEVMMFHMIGAAWAAAYDKWLASGGDRIAKQAVIDTLKKNDPNAYELRLADKLERELATA